MQGSEGTALDFTTRENTLSMALGSCSTAPHDRGHERAEALWLDPNDLLRTVDMLDLPPNHLAGAQAAAIAETEQRADLEIAGDGQQAPRLVRAHHPRYLLGLTDVIDLGGKIQAPQSHAERFATAIAPPKSRGRASCSPCRPGRNRPRPPRPPPPTNPACCHVHAAAAAAA